MRTARPSPGHLRLLLWPTAGIVYAWATPLPDDVQVLSAGAACGLLVLGVGQLTRAGRRALGPVTGLALASLTLGVLLSLAASLTPLCPGEGRPCGRDEVASYALIGVLAPVALALLVAPVKLARTSLTAVLRAVRSRQRSRVRTGKS